jgi:hypothetical protein
MRIVRILGTLEPGGAQLSALRLSAALRRHGMVTTLLAGDATAPALELVARYGLPMDAYRDVALFPARERQQHHARTSGAPPEHNEHPAADIPQRLRPAPAVPARPGIGPGPAGHRGAPAAASKEPPACSG